MHITVAVGPTTGINLDNEFNLLKSALLYGDQITLCSHKASLLKALSPLKDIGTDELFNLVAQLLPMLPQASGEGVSQDMANLVGDYAKGLLHKKGHLTTQQNIQKLSFIHAHREVVSNFQNFFKDSGTARLMELLKDGRVDLHEFARPDLDFLASDYISFVYGAVSDGKTYPLLDDQSGNLVRMFAKESEEQISDVDKGRIKHVHVADNLFRRLPGFETATLDEVVDIRDELSKPLIKFRSGLIDIAETIKSASWDEDFEKEVDILVLSKVEPAVQEIEEQMRIVPALSAYLGKPKEVMKAVTERAAFGAVIGKFSDFHGITLAALGATVGAGTALVQGILESREKASQNQMYFYYKVGKKLDN